MIAESKIRHAWTLGRYGHAAIGAWFPDAAESDVKVMLPNFGKSCGTSLV